MFSRLLRLLLALAVVLFSQSTIVAMEPSAKMECCAMASHEEKCPDCPASQGDTHPCCCQSAMAWIAPAGQTLIFSAESARHSFATLRFFVRSDRPLLPPPKLA